MNSREYQYNQSTVKLFFGDITFSDAEVIVSSDDSDLSMGGGVSSRICEAAGDDYYRIVSKYHPVRLGDVVVTDAGELKQKYVFHSVSLDTQAGDRSSEFSSIEDYHAFIIRHSVDKCFRLIQSMNLSSIAFPLIGTGVAQIPLLSAARLMAESFAKNLQKTNRSLTVELYLYDRFNQWSDMDYVGVFEQFAIMSEWGRYMKDGPVPEDVEEDPVILSEVPSLSMKHDVFISYWRDDSEQAKKILEILENKGISYWIDREGMHSQGSFKAVLVDAIKVAEAVIFLSSKHSNQSQFVIKEISLAINYDKMVIPIMLDDTPFAKEIEFDLHDIDRLDYNGDFAKKLIMNIQFRKEGR